MGFIEKRQADYGSRGNPSVKDVFFWGLSPWPPNFQVLGEAPPRVPLLSLPVAPSSLGRQGLNFALSPNRY